MRTLSFSLSNPSRAALAALALAVVSTLAGAAPDGAPRQSRDGPPGRGAERGAERGVDRGVEHGARSQRGEGRWFDGAHGHAHAYPVPGRAVRALPPRSRVVIWSGVHYGFADGVWYAPGLSGHVVVRPPYGIVVGELPLFRTVVTIGGIAYLYANGAYYRELVQGGYEVVPPPVPSEPAAADVTRSFVYPRLGQSAEQQATDEYDCHRWAATQSGFDPSAVATSTPGADVGRRVDYQRARLACLEGRNYTVR